VVVGQGRAGSSRGGREAVFAQFGRYGGETAGTFRAELLHVLTGHDGRAIGIHHNTAQRGDKTLDVHCCIVFEITDGRVIAGREHFFDLYVWDEFWS
jgi:ketosteroid isomerase-like protein